MSIFDAEPAKTLDNWRPGSCPADPDYPLMEMQALVHPIHGEYLVIYRYPADYSRPTKVVNCETPDRARMLWRTYSCGEEIKRLPIADRRNQGEPLS